MVRDVTVALVGETHAGKATLVAALRDDHGVSRVPDMTSSSRSSHHAPPTFEVHQFDMRTATSAGSDVTGPCHMCALVLANDVLDTFSQQVCSDGCSLLQSSVWFCGHWSMGVISN